MGVADIVEMFAIEQKFNVLTKTVLLLYDEAHDIKLVNLDENNAQNSEIIQANHGALKIQRLTNDMFITLDETGTQIRRLIVKYSAKGIELNEIVIYETDLNAKIIHFVGEIGKLYLMVDERFEITIKVLSFDQNPKRMT